MIYLAGPMGRTVGHNNTDAFAAAADELIAVGYAVCNPADFPMDDDYRGVCEGVRTVALEHIEGVALLEGWGLSAGARAEAICAVSLGKPARFVSDWVSDGTLSARPRGDSRAAYSPIESRLS